MADEHYQGEERTAIINSCMIANGQVVSINRTEKTALVHRESLVKTTAPGYRVITAENQSVKLDPDLTPNLQPNDLVAIHLGYIAGTLTPVESTNLSFWTKKVAPLI